MKKNVELSSYCWFISSVSTALLCGASVYVFKESGSVLAISIWGIAIAILFLSALLFMPLSISIDKDKLSINRPLLKKSIRLSDIAEARLCSPTMGAIRLCGSGGWFGWFGWFKESDIGKYFAYYGKSSDCFLVTLKNGKKYMLGCEDAPAMVDAINANIN